MLRDYNKYKPLMTFGLLLAIAGIIGFFMGIVILRESNMNSDMAYFAFIMSIWHFSTGLGVIIKKPWGYYLLKIYLYFMLIGIPIGTMISMKILKYIKDNEIKDYFMHRSLEL